MGPSDVQLTSTTLPMVLVGAGIVHAIAQEELQRSMRMPLLMTAAEFGICALCSLSWMGNFGRGAPPPPRWQLLRISVCVLCSLVSGNIALRYVSYPVKVVAKSCKLLPTMFLGTVLLRKRYSALDQLAAVLLCAGLVGFTLSSRSSGGDKDSSNLGIGLLLCSVSCDAVQVLLSERMLRAHPALTPMHANLYSNGFGFFGVLSLLHATGELAEAPTSIPWALLALSGFLSWVCVCCSIQLTRTQGATACVDTGVETSAPSTPSEPSVSVAK